MPYIHIIWNPVAGGGAANNAYAQLVRRLELLGVPHSAAMSEYPGHARRLAAEAAAAGTERILVLGGDGTVREVASELLHTDTALGIIPCGTGNDLSRPLGIPTDIGQALDIALGGVPREMDAFTVNGEICFNVFGFGFDVDVLDKTELYKRRYKNGSMAYLRGLLTAISGMTLRRTKLTWPEGGMETDALLVAVGNGTHFGGGMNITPGADPFDGLLDVCVIHDVKKRHLPTMLPKFLAGKHVGTRFVTYFRTSALEATCEPTSRIDADGEVLEGIPASIRIVPRAIKVLVRANERQN